MNPPSFSPHPPKKKYEKSCFIVVKDTERKMDLIGTISRSMSYYQVWTSVKRGEWERFTYGNIVMN